MTDDKNGWKNGNDPVLRTLRAGAAVVLLGVFVVLTLDPARSGDYGPLGLSIGALMVLLGYEGALRWPGNKP